MGSEGRRGGDDKRKWSAKGREKQMPPARPLGERGWGGGGQENGVWGTLDKPGWSRGCCRERSREKEGLLVLPALGGF